MPNTTSTFRKGGKEDPENCRQPHLSLWECNRAAYPRKHFQALEGKGGGEEKGEGRRRESGN